MILKRIYNLIRNNYDYGLNKILSHSYEKFQNYKKFEQFDYRVSIKVDTSELPIITMGCFDKLLRTKMVYDQ